MKKLLVTINCLAVYNSSIYASDNMTLKEAIEYAKEHLDEDDCVFEEDII